MNNRFLRIALALLAVLAIVACERRPLFDPNESVLISVEVDTDNISNVTCDIYNPDPALVVPSVTTDMMRVMVYDPVNDGLLTQSFISDKTINERGHEVISGTLNLGYGDFDFLVYNFDTPDTFVRDENDQNTITAYTNEAPASIKETYTKATDFTKLKTFFEPDHFFVARKHDVHVSMRDTLVIVKAVANTIVDTYYIQIPVSKLPDGTECFGEISGMSPANAFGPNQPSKDATGVYFKMIKSQDEKLTTENKDVLCGIFSTFGKILDANSDVRFTVKVTDSQGNEYQHKDVDLNVIFKSDNAIKHHWLLIDDLWEIDIPDKPGTSGGGFQPEVTPWDPVEGGIDL